jgi:hypothetical protein
MEEDFFKQIDLHASSTTHKVGEKPLIIIDASNVAMRHGKNSFFSVKGLQIVVEYWQKNGHQVVCFLPDYLFSYDQVALKKKLNNLNIKEYKASQMPDNVALLNKLATKGYIVKTPPQDYDDSYCIQYAKRSNAFIVTNDKFRDFILKQPNSEDRLKEQRWVKDHSISFTFNGDEFLPNPDSKLFNKHASYETYKNFPLEEI